MYRRVFAIGFGGSAAWRMSAFSGRISCFSAIWIMDATRSSLVSWGPLLLSTGPILWGERLGATRSLQQLAPVRLSKAELRGLWAGRLPVSVLFWLHGVRSR